MNGSLNDGAVPPKSTTTKGTRRDRRMTNDRRSAYVVATRVTVVVLFSLMLLPWVIQVETALTMTVSPVEDNVVNDVPMRLTNDDSAKQEPPRRREVHNWTIFYNLYFSPTDEPMRRHAETIVEEQWGQIGQARSNAQGMAENLVLAVDVRYVTIGALGNHTWLKEVARRNGLHAQHIQHYDKGYEGYTLQRLYEFCRANPNETVIYLHNKGSKNKQRHRSNDSIKNATTTHQQQHSTGYRQDNLRRQLTAAATHPACWQATSGTFATTTPQTDQCQVCGFSWQPLPAIHFPGNMWTASCAYIRHLVSPESFSRVMREFHIVVRQHDQTDKAPTCLIGTVGNNNNSTNQREAGSVKFRLWRPTFPATGRNRFALEHWVGSHPGLNRPCQLASTNPDYNVPDFVNETRGTANYDTALVRFRPPYPLHDTRWHFYHNAQCLLGTTNKTNKNNNQRTESISRHTVDRESSVHDVRLSQQELREDAEVQPQEPIEPQHLLPAPCSQYVLDPQWAALRKTDYFLLPGLLWKWLVIYPRARVPADSWIWDWFPDGSYWRQQYPSISTM